MTTWREVRNFASQKCRLTPDSMGVRRGGQKGVSPPWKLGLRAKNL